MIRLVAAASSSIEVKGICAALTDIPRDSNSEMTFVQLSHQPKHHAPARPSAERLASLPPFL